MGDDCPPVTYRFKDMCYLDILTRFLAGKSTLKTSPPDSVLQIAAEMYFYCVNSLDNDSSARKKYSDDHFENASPRTIVETVLISSTDKLVQKLGTFLTIKTGKWDIASSTKSGLLSRMDNVEFAHLRL